MVNTDSKEALELLADAVFMLKEIERNRQMPPLAQTQQQYVALGKRITEYLEAIN